MNKHHVRGGLDDWLVGCIVLSFPKVRQEMRGLNGFLEKLVYVTKGNSGNT